MEILGRRNAKSIRVDDLFTDSEEKWKEAELVVVNESESAKVTSDAVYKKLKPEIATEDQVCLVWNDVDLEKMKAMITSPETAAGKAKHTVIDPIEIYIEVDGGT